jgi:polyisoprenoid-binding protein YceI
MARDRSHWFPAAAIGASLLLGAPVVGAQPATYRLDPEHTTVAFLVTHIGYAKVLGQFGSVIGSFRFDETAGTISDVEVVVETASVSTGHATRDRHLSSDDFLASERFPRMTFVAERSRRTGELTFEIDGQLELRGTTRPLTLNATLNKSGEYPIGDRAHVVGVSARGRLQRSDFGMTYAVDNGWVGDDVELMIELEARQGEP